MPFFPFLSRFVPRRAGISHAPPAWWWWEGLLVDEFIMEQFEAAAAFVVRFECVCIPFPGARLDRGLDDVLFLGLFCCLHCDIIN